MVVSEWWSGGSSVGEVMKKLCEGEEMKMCEGEEQKRKFRGRRRGCLKGKRRRREKEEEGEPV